MLESLDGHACRPPQMVDPAIAQRILQQSRMPSQVELSWLQDSQSDPWDRWRRQRELAGRTGISATGLPQRMASQLSAPPLSALPSPGELLRKTSAAEVGKRNIAGYEYETSLPSHRIQDSGLDPYIQFGPNGNGFQNVAYAIYHLQLPGYSGPSKVLTNWDALPIAGNLLYGVAEYSAQSWRWVAGDALEAVTLPDGDYVSDNGDVLIVVLLRGINPAKLNLVNFGGDLPPTAVLAANPIFGELPYETNVSAAASHDDEGIIVKYEWDLNTDGVFELDKGEDPLLTQTVQGSGSIGLRVTDDIGQTATATLTFLVDAEGYDEAEPNNDVLTEQSLLPFGGIVGWDGNLGVGGYDGSLIDNYLINATEDVRLRYEVSSGNSEPMGAIVWNVQDTAVVATGQPGLGMASVDVRVHKGQSYVLQLICLPERPAYDYTLSCEVNTDIKYDEVEGNDTPGAADLISAEKEDDFYGNLGADGYDGDSADFTILSAVAGEGTMITAEFNTSTADIDLELTDLNGTPLASSTETEGNATLYFVAPESGEYFLRTYIKEGSPPEAQSDYILRLQRLGVAPTAALDITPDSGSAPLAVNLDLTGCSVAPDETLSYVLFDWNNDGDTDTAGLDFSSIPLTLYGNGDTVISLKVVQSDGQEVRAEDNCTVSGSYSESEPNDDVLTEADVLPGSDFADFLAEIGPGIDSGGNDDWYSFYADNNGMGSIYLNYEYFFDPVYMELRDSNLVPLGSDLSDDGSLEIQNNMVQGGLYYLVVYTDNSSSLEQGYMLSSDMP
ncbi:hypothetical protein IT575_13330 [bacterium]|nr:hypothetical protein [bacterium]